MEFSRKLNPIILAATALSASVEAATFDPFESLRMPANVSTLDGNIEVPPSPTALFTGARELKGKTAAVEVMSGKAGKIGWDKEHFEALFKAMHAAATADAGSIETFRANYVTLLSGVEKPDARRGQASLDEKSAYANLLVQSMIWEGFNDDEIKAAFEYVDQLSGFNPNFRAGNGVTGRSGLSGMLPNTRAVLLEEIGVRCATQGCSDSFNKLPDVLKDVVAFEELITRARAATREELAKGTIGEKYSETLVVNVAQLERKIAKAAGVTEFVEAEGTEGELGIEVGSNLKKRADQLESIIKRTRDAVAGNQATKRANS